MGQVCSGANLPPGYLEVWVGPADCDDADANRFVSWGVFADTDGDEVGAGPQLTLCAGEQLPAGHSLEGDDCAPEDKELWQQQAYSHRDADGDGASVPEQGTLCVGPSLPPGYLTAAVGTDCDDANASVSRSVLAFPDKDGDGIGAGTGEAYCTDGSAPVGHSLQGSDCAPQEAARWQQLAYSHVDMDGDGHSVPSSGSLCAGQDLPPSYLTRAAGNDCDDARAAFSRWTVLYLDADGDGFGAGAREVQCIGATLPQNRSLFGDDADDADPNLQKEDDDELELLLALDP